MQQQCLRKVILFKMEIKMINDINDFIFMWKYICKL